MIEQYGLFLAKGLTAMLMGLGLMGGKKKSNKSPEIEFYNETFYKLQQDTLGKLKLPTFKQLRKQLKKRKKQIGDFEKHLFVIDFKGDLKATGVTRLRKEIDLILSIAQPNDQILLRLNSPGGTVTGYGLVSSQIQRIRDANIPLTIAIDQVAASGGYMIASLANEIISAPYACIGSIGVVYEAPNFNEFLAKKGINYNQVTAGKYKRTMSMLGENTPEGESKMKEDLEMTHDLFQNHVTQYRDLDLDKVATGETWPAIVAHKKGLVDRIYTSDAFIQDHLETHAILIVKTKEEKSLLKAFKQKSHALLQHVG